MKILKFGGSSVGNPTNIKKVLGIIKQYKKDPEQLAIVVSAFKGVTDSLLDLGRDAAHNRKFHLGKFQSLQKHHLQIIKELFPNQKTRDVISGTNELFTALLNLLCEINKERSIRPAISDQLTSFGERLSANIISRYLNINQIPNDLIDTRDLIVTDKHYTCAKVLPHETNSKLIEYFSIRKKDQVVTGFIASSIDGQTTTLGRGGSDYTASILGSALDASSIDIWTDVDGIMTKDPNKSSEAKTIPKISCQKAIKMSLNGAKVIYAPTISLAAKKNIPIYIKNTFNPQFKGTLIY